jgi:hypothetical protein
MSGTTSQAIPFRPEYRASGSNAVDVLLILALLLGSFVVALWFARKKGWLDRWIVAAPGIGATKRAGLELEQVLRLSQKSALYRVNDGSTRYLVLESAGAAQVLKTESLQGSHADE